MDEEELADYGARSEDLIQQSPQMDEANTKVRLVQPLIAKLGWDVRTPEVELEYPVQMGTGTKKVDYALMLEDTPAVFIEAKGCDTSLSETHRNQLRSYLRIVGVEWGVLTNGKRFEVFKRRTDSNRPEEVVLGRFTIDELADKKRLLNALSKESITSGESEEIAENIERVRTAIETLRKQKDRIAQNVVDAVTTELDTQVPVRIENDAKEFVDDLIASLEDHGTGVDHQDEPYEDESPDFWDRVEKQVGIRHTNDEIKLRQDRSAVDDFLDFIEYLFEADYIRYDDLPYNPGGPKRYLINTSPTHVDGSEMYNAHEVLDGVFVETHNSTEDKKRYIQTMAEDFADGV